MQFNIGNGSIQTGGDLTVLAIISGIKDVGNIDQALDAVHDHHFKLRSQRGRIDWRILLMAGFAASFMAALHLGGIFTILYIVAAAFLYGGMRVQRVVDRIDAELDGAKALRTELYRLKIARQIGAI